jgi:tRNA/tmRNA/rRNA uracil-C5-methylase (TrmA/RlmC/RlmD family)
LPVYDQKRHSGFFRHLVIREGVQTGQLMVNLVIADAYLHESSTHTAQRESLQSILTEDKRLREQVTTFMITTNNGLADIVKTQDSSMNLLRGDGVIHEKLILSKENTNLIQHHDDDQTQEHESVELTFRIGPFSFFQTNTY